MTTSPERKVAVMQAVVSSTLKNAAGNKQTKICFNIPNGGKWVRGWLKEELGSRVKMEWISHQGNVWWIVSKDHLHTLTAALQSKGYDVIQHREYSTKQICTASCQGAQEDHCICSCGGQFHGDPSGEGWRNVIGDCVVRNETKTVTRLFPANAEAPKSTI